MDKAFEPGRMVVGLCWGGKARFLAVVLPGPAAELAERHELENGASKRAAEGLVAAALLASHIKGEERLTLDIQATSPVFAFVADVNGDGTIRGRFRPPDVRDQAEFFGMISATKSLLREELYRGISEVQGETMEAALDRFFRSSQQSDALVRLGVSLDDEGIVASAAGLLIERLPEGDTTAFNTFIQPLREMPISELSDSLAFGLLGGEPVEVLGTSDLVFRCGCSSERVRSTLRALGRIELAEMIAEQGGAEVICHYCNEVYTFDAASLEAIRGTIGES